MPQLSTSDDAVLVASALAAALLLLAGVLERRRHAARSAAVPWRISVNGSRGKSTVARLATGALAAGGYRPVGKTTGTEARLIDGETGAETAIVRRPEGPNIGEQREVTRQAAARGADALVVECMAVTPEYQDTFHAELLAANALVITNVLADHLEEMGPTTADVAEVLAEGIPRDGLVVVAPGPFVPVFREVAERRGAKLRVASPEAVDPAVLARFPYLVFPEHVALVLALCAELGISERAALEGMWQAGPDPYATRLLPVGDPDDPALFVNAFPANDPASALGIWEHVVARGHPADASVVIMNCRGDRVARTRQFAEEVLPHLPIGTLVIAGEETQAVRRAVQRGRVAAGEVLDRTGADPEAIVDELAPLLAGRVVLGVGNLHGAGRGLIAALEARAAPAPASDAPTSDPEEAT